MITCKELPGQSFESQAEMFKALVDNMPLILSVTKNQFKAADSFTYSYVEEFKSETEVVKANKPVVNEDLTELKVRVVINTTNLLDSHGDVHIKGLWNRSLSHSDKRLLLQEHKKAFDAVIASDSLAYVKTLAWKTLGANYEGSTQALVFDSVIKQSRNPFMFQQYKDGYVNNHSVGMQYVEMVYCIDTEESWAKDYKDNWDKYYPMIANKEDADLKGYFTAVLEAKVVEGSAVLFGSNFITPTLENNMKSANPAPLNIPDPAIATQEKQKSYYSGFLN